MPVQVIMVDFTTSPTKHRASFPSRNLHLTGATNRSTNAHLRLCPMADSVAIVGRPPLAISIIQHPCKVTTSQFQRPNCLHHYQFKPTLLIQPHHSARQHSRMFLHLRSHHIQFHMTVVGFFPRSAIAPPRAWLAARNLLQRT